MKTQSLHKSFVKLSFTLVLIFLANFSIYAQNEPKDELLLILGEMKNEFSSLTGAIETKDTVEHYTNYTPLNKLSSSESVITEIFEEASSRKALVYFYNYENTDALIASVKYLTPLLDIVNARIQLGMYKGRDYTNESGRSVTEVTDLEGNYLIDIVSNAEWGLKFVFYSKNWGKN
ncbi:MAG: hypothetical protein V4622_13880 [Bacteroidota bacterium]